MNKTLTIILTLFVQITFGQQKFQFEQIDVAQIEEVEKANNGIIKDTIIFGIISNNLEIEKLTKTRTFIYTRVNDDFTPKLHVWYHIDTTSNKLLAITYNWDFYNPSFNADKNEELLVEANKREKEYQAKYKELNKILQEIFKKPTKVDLLNDNDYSFNEITYWENQELYVYSRITFQRKINKIPVIGLAGNHFVVEMVISFK